MAQSILGRADRGAIVYEPYPHIVVENALPGTDDDWYGYEDRSIEGFATQHSVNAGETISFKIRTDASSYHIRIYRVGWYGGKGARFITQITPSVNLPQSQPEPYFDETVRLTDCANWAVSASWAVPASAVSGVYVRPGDIGNTAGSPKMCVRQSHVPRGTAKLTGVDGCEAPDRPGWEAM